MRSMMFKASLAGVALATIAGCATMGNVGGDLADQGYQRDPPPQFTEKIDLHIPFDKVELTADNKAELTEFLKGLRTATKDRDVVTLGAIVVTGHTEGVGPLSDNMKISERLAKIAKDHLVNSENVNPTLIFWEGMGSKQPIPVTKFCDNKMRLKQRMECLAPNRRVTIEIVGAALPHSTVLPPAYLAAQP